MDDRGFTLIEVMIAMMVLSFALLAMAQMQITAIQATTSANALIQTTTVAQDKLEELMALPYDHQDLDDNTQTGTFTTHTDPNPPAGYTVQWQVDSDVPAQGNKTVNIIVTRTNPQNPKTISLSFIKSSLQ